MPEREDGVYERPDRGGYWISWTDAQGRRRRRKLQTDLLSQARRARAAELLRVEQAKILGFTPPTDDSFAQLAERYLDYQRVRLAAKSYEREKLALEKHLQLAFAGPVKAIRRVDIERYVTQRSATASAATVAKELDTVKHMLRLAVDWEIIPVNPAQGVKSPKLPPGRVRYLQPTELHLLLEACPSWLRPIAGLAVATDMRRGEILGLRWLDVDMAHHRILLPQTKNGEGRVVYLNGLALAVLESLIPAAPMQRLFSGPTPAQVSVAFQRACRTAGVVDFRFHDLRHTAASWLRMSGADIHTVAQLLGHRDLRMAARYQHLSPAFLAEAVERLDSVFGGEVRRLAANEAAEVAVEVSLAR